MNFFLQLKHKRWHFDEQLMPSIWEKILWSIKRLVTDFLQNVFFWVQQKKETHTILKQVEGSLRKWWQNFHFWVNSPFHLSLQSYIRENIKDPIFNVSSVNWKMLLISITYLVFLVLILENSVKIQVEATYG